MKQNILLTSLGAALLASVLGVMAVMHQGNIDMSGNAGAALDSFITTARLYQLAGISGLFSIASFFVGLAYPAGEIVTYTVDGKGSETKTVVNG